MISGTSPLNAASCNAVDPPARAFTSKPARNHRVDRLRGPRLVQQRGVAPLRQAAQGVRMIRHEGVDRRLISGQQQPGQLLGVGDRPHGRPGRSQVGQQVEPAGGDRVLGGRPPVRQRRARRRRRGRSAAAPGRRTRGRSPTAAAGPSSAGWSRRPRRAGASTARRRRGRGRTRTAPPDDCRPDGTSCCTTSVRRSGRRRGSAAAGPAAASAGCRGCLPAPCSPSPNTPVSTVNGVGSPSHR